MRASIVQYIALILMAGVAVLFAVEIFRWRSMGAVVGRKQRILRSVLALLIETFLLMVFYGPMVTARKDAFSELIYWCVCVLVGLLVIIIALLDLRELIIGFPAVHRQMFLDAMKGENSQQSTVDGQQSSDDR